MPKPIKIQTIIATTGTFEIYQEICDDTQNPDYCNVAMVCRTIEDSKIDEIYREHLLSVISSLYNAISIYKQQDKNDATDKTN